MESRGRDIGIRLSIALVMISILSIFALSSSFSIPSTNSQSSDSINYKGSVCVWKNGELVDCNHNLLYDLGKNITRDILGNAATGTPRTISVCNASAGCGTPIATAIEPYNAYNNCGLSNITGTYNTLNNAPGNWTISTTFTSTCNDVLLNSTRLQNASSSPFAGNTFTLVTLHNGDQVTINWTVQVS